MLRISKTIKKIALSLLVVGLAIGTQSYKNAEEKIPNTLVWYEYDISKGFLEPEITDPLNYSSLGANVEPGCDGEVNICAILHNDDGLNPIFIGTTAADIWAAQDNHTGTADIKLQD